MLFLLEGPAGSGKSQLARDMKRAGQVDLLADTTRLWAAVGDYDRPYPVRDDDDPALGAALYLQTIIVGYALDRSLRVAVTTSRRGQIDRWAGIAAEHGAGFSLATVDPGIEVVRARLAEPDGSLSNDCAKAISRWYG